MSHRRKRIVAGGFGILFLMVASMPVPTTAHQGHPDRPQRIKQCLQGDVKQTARVAVHTTDYALARFALHNLLTQSDIQRTQKEMYNFLKWKLGSPTAVCGQYVSTGYGHFEKTYSDEAAAMMLGVISFAQVTPELVMPRWMQEYLKVQAGTSAGAITALLVAHGVPSQLASLVGQKVAEILVKGVARNVAVFIPKAYDVDNRLVELAIKARLEAQTARRDRPRKFSQ